MSVVEAVFAFDGKHVADLKEAASTFQTSEAGALHELCQSETLGYRVAATWIVKALHELGNAEALDMQLVFRRIEVESDWEPLLHLLQTVQFNPVAASPLKTSVNAQLNHPKTLVRVWALDALVRIALSQCDELVAARERVQIALTDQKASVRARARQLAPLLGL